MGAGTRETGTGLTEGITLWPAFLAPDAQGALVELLRGILREAPLSAYETRSGRRMSVRMSAAGRLGWVSDRTGYRYADSHPSGTPWPEIPDPVMEVWRAVSGVQRAPDCCLINFYGEGARMGLHQDRDEASFDWPVVSVSLGDDALFRFGGTTRGGPTRSVWLGSGDVLVMEGPARLAYHGIDRIRFRSSRLLRDGGRINLTLRVAG